MTKIWNADAELARIQAESRRSKAFRRLDDFVENRRPAGSDRDLITRRSDTVVPYDPTPDPGPTTTSAGSKAQSILETRVPGAMNLENVGEHLLSIRYLPAQYQVTFPAFITQFSDAYNSAWNSEKVYGRMDPMGTFMHTKRNISLAFDVPAESCEHAEGNLYKINKLISFLYPVYQRNENQDIGVMNQDPFWQVNFGNLIQNSQTGGPLLGFVNGITVDPSIEDGFFNRLGPTGRAEYYPKNVRLNFEFTVMHEHPLGFEASVGKREPVKVAGQHMDKTVITYRFNDPKLSFGNFPYVTDEFAPSIRTSEAIIPQLSGSSPSVRADRRKGVPPQAQGLVSFYDVYRNAILNSSDIVNAEDLMGLYYDDQALGHAGYNPQRHLLAGDIRYLVELDYARSSMPGYTSNMIRVDPENAKDWGDLMKKFGVNPLSNPQF